MKRNVKQNNRSVGAVYEQAAGYDGEIDIIAKDGDCYVFCEVKYRSGRQAGNPLEAVDQRKQKKIFRCALYYTVQHGIEDAQCRFDVIGVEGTEITHIKNAFVG